MKQSQLFTKTTKNFPKDETSFNAQILIKAGFIDKLAAGIYSFLPLGQIVHEKIKNIIREEMNAIGGQEVLMPALIPKEHWDKTGRWDAIDVLFKLKGSDKKEYALGATHEEVVSPLVRKHAFSYKELPVYVYQIQTKFRNELRAKAGLLRGREFSMKDLYSFHTSQEDLDNFYEKAKQAYFNIFNRAGLGEITYYTYASGGAFSKYSHEFQTLSEAGEDIIYICDKCHLAINKEIIEDLKICQECGNSDLRQAKAIETANIFKLGSRYTKPFDFTFTNDQGEAKEVLMGCYGIGLSRLIGAIVEVHHDDKGIIWPSAVAPFQFHLISLNKKTEADKIYDELIKNNIEVLYDDREMNAGEKFADADLIGLPYRLVVSEKSIQAGGIEIKRRNEKESKIIKMEELIKYCQNL
jgi:prolyl-tRNA synthetase